MNRNYDNDNMQEESKDQGPSGTGWKVFFAVMVVAIIAALLVIIFITKKEYTGSEVVSQTQILSDARVIGMDNGFCAYNRDGASGYDDDAELIWNICYNYKDPIGAVCGEFAVFADKGGQSAVITDGTGAQSNIEIPGQIRECRVAENGNAALLADAGEQDNIFIYDKKGQKVLEIRTDVRRMGFPMTIALSPDGKKLVTSYLAIEEEPGCRVTFYNFGDVGQNYSDKIVGSFDYNNEIIPFISFVDDTYVCVCGEKTATIYKFSEIPEVSRTFNYDGTIKGIGINDSDVAIAVTDSYGRTYVRWYDRTGDLRSETTTNIGFDEIYPDEGELLVTAGNTFAIYDSDGSEKIRTVLTTRIEAAFATDSTDEYLIIGDGKAQVIRLVRGEKEDPFDEDGSFDDEEDIDFDN